MDASFEPDVDIPMDREGVTSGVEDTAGRWVRDGLNFALEDIDWPLAVDVLLGVPFDETVAVVVAVRVRGIACECEDEALGVIEGERLHVALGVEVIVPVTDSVPALRLEDTPRLGVEVGESR